MLVLSRKTNQSICFPSLGVSVKVCKIAGNAVRIGIEAPREVTVLRAELCDNAHDFESSTREMRHRRRNQLNEAQLALSLAQKQLECGQSGAARKTLNQAMEALTKLDADLGQVRRPAKTEPTKSARKRALVVEDNENERELLAGYLRLSGFQVETASNGLEAIRRLSKPGSDLPQAVVLDMKMPSINGAKTVSNIRYRDELKDLKLFAVSASTPSEMEVPVGPDGVNRWFPKPVDPEELVRQISSEIITDDSEDLAPGELWPLGVRYMNVGQALQEATS